MILSGLRVVEVATYIAAPAAASVLSDFGAEVVKVERLPNGDPYRHLYQMPTMPVSEHNYCYMLEGRNKESIGLNLTSPEGRDVLLKLVAQADIYITNYQFSTLDKLRLRYEDIKHDRLIYAHVTGYGDTGMDVERPGFDMTAYWARSGLMASMHTSDGDPSLSVPGFGDHPTSMTVFGAIMLALYKREKTGLGSRVTTSLMANGVWSNGALVQSVLCDATGYRLRTRREHNPMVNYYRARDGKWFILCAIQPEHDWPRLCRSIERLELESNPKFVTSPLRQENGEELVDILDAEFIKHDLAEWIRRFAEQQLPWGPVATIDDVAADPQMRAAEVIVPLDDPQRPGMETVHNPIRMDGERKRAPGPAPEIGEHTGKILKQLGYSDDAIDDLASRGIAKASVATIYQ